MHGLVIPCSQTLVLVNLFEANSGLVGVDLNGQILDLVSDAFFAGDALRALLDPSRSAQAFWGFEIAGVHAQILGYGLSAPGLAPLLDRMTQSRIAAVGLSGW